MGIFSTKRRYHVDTAVVRVIDDGQVPKSHLSGAIEAVVSGRPIASSIQNAVLNGPYQKFEKMYRFAAEEGNYLYGLPDVRSLSSDDGYAEAQAVIEDELGTEITVEYLHFRPLNNIHAGFQIITDEYGYDHESNELTVLSADKGYPVYLEDLVANYVVPAGEEPEATSRSAFGGTPQAGYTPLQQARTSSGGLQGLVKSRDWTESPTGTEGVTLKYIWEDDQGEVFQESEFKDLEVLYDHTAEYYQAHFRYISGGKEARGYWTYNPEDGLHPSLDDVLGYSYTSPGSYFPFAIFRRSGNNYATEAFEGTDEFEQTKELLDNIGLDFEELGAEIYSNPDIDQIEQAVLMMAVPVNSDDPAEIEYLFRFFTWLEQNTAITPPLGTIESEVAGPGITPNRAIEFKDGGFRVVMSYDDVQWRRHAGVIGPRGAYTREADVVENQTTIAGPGGARVKQIYRYQVSDSVYEVVTVLNPRMRYDIRDDHKVLGNGVDENCILPINREIAQQMSLVQREQLYYRSLHLVFNSYVVEKVKWYQRGAFKVVLSIAAIVIAFYTGYFDGIVAAIAEGSLVGVAQTVAIMYIKQIIISGAFQLLVEAVGMEASFIIAIVAAVAGAGFGIFGSDAQVGWAEKLLQASLGLTQGVNTNLAATLSEYQAEASEFQLMAEQKWEELEEVNKLLDTPNLLDPFAFVGMTPLSRHNESPDQFYTRTIHSGNVGALGFDFVESFVDISLKLPDIQDTLGDSFYV